MATTETAAPAANALGMTPASSSGGNTWRPESSGVGEGVGAGVGAGVGSGVGAGVGGMYLWQ